MQLMREGIGTDQEILLSYILPGILTSRVRDGVFVINMPLGIYFLNLLNHWVIFLKHTGIRATLKNF